MDMTELEHISRFLNDAQTPEDVFGNVTGTPAERLAAGKVVFRQIAKTVHPDTYQGTANYDQAEAAFKKLARWWEQAQAGIMDGTYGVAADDFLLSHGGKLYTLGHIFAYGDLCALYKGTWMEGEKRVKGIFKIPVKPQDNDLVANEARILRHLSIGKGSAQLHHFASHLVASFPYQEKDSGVMRQVNVLSFVDGLYSLKEVKDAYPRGIDPRDMAWIWRRLLVALGFAHDNKVIHGSVLPTHILIHPQQHGVVLIDWSYAVLDPHTTGESIRAISISYREWYPEEVIAREEPTRGLDIAMAARCMVDLLGGNIFTITMPETVPWQIQQHLKGCVLPQPQQRLQDVATILSGFDAIIERLWGPRTFRVFRMPER